MKNGKLWKRLENVRMMKSGFLRIEMSTPVLPQDKVEASTSLDVGLRRRGKVGPTKMSCDLSQRLVIG
jgi:hypothetical protein